MKNHDLRPIDSQAFLEANAIQNNKATKLDATSSGTSIISIVKKIVQKEKC